MKIISIKQKEAIPESLKNILLVMETAGCFHGTLAAITWDRISVFLPTLYEDMVPPQINVPALTTSNPIEASLPNNELESQSEKNTTVEADPQIPNQNMTTDQTINQNIPEVSQHFIEQISSPVIGNSTFIDMEEGLKTPFSGLMVGQSSPSYPLPTYPGSIEPFVPISQPISNSTQRDPNFVANAHMSAYPWPAPSDQKNF